MFRLFVGRLYNSRKKAQGGDRKSNRQNDGLKSTAESIANEHGTSERTVERAAKQAEAMPVINVNIRTVKTLYIHAALSLTNKP